jgi:hypothetical protein
MRKLLSLMNPRGNILHHLLKQIGSIIPGYKEDGLFLMIGKKMLNEISINIKNINKSTSEIRKFGIMIGIFLLLIAGFLYFSENELFLPFIILGTGFIIIGLLLPIMLKPFYLAWMIFAAILGSVMTRVILSFTFYFILTPTSLIARIFGGDIGQFKITNKDSYWNIRKNDNESNQDYEKQF